MDWDSGLENHRQAPITYYDLQDDDNQRYSSNHQTSPHPHAHAHAQLSTYRHQPPATFASSDPAHDASISAAFASHHAFSKPVNLDSLYNTSPVNRVSDGAHMPSTSQQRSAVRSPIDAATPRPTQMPLKPGQSRPNSNRSASTPVDTKTTPGLSKGSLGGKPSVRDLKKRFDQADPVPSAATGTSRGASRSVTTTTPGWRANKQSPVVNGASYSALRTGASPSPSSSTSSRSRFVAEDSVSTNPQSFASRVSKPRNLTNGNAVAAKSMTTTSHAVAPRARPPSPPPNAPRSHGLLFGEILPEQYHQTSAGHGIDRFQTRRLPEPGALHQTGHNRSFSDPDIEFANPADWYQNGVRQTNDAQTQVRAPSKGHARSQSEVTVQKVSSPPPPQPFSQPLEPSSSSHIPAPSKLPVAIRKRNSPTTSGPSTRSNSPTKLKSSQANGRTSRAGTPISRAKTPTQSSATRKHNPAAAAKSNSSTRLQAVVTPPIPKMSPPLRSSRPRQPVSSATTASSRSKAASNGKTSQSSKQRIAEKKEEVPARRRKISVGPIDFEQRREHIRLAYSKSIRESQAVEARRRAADRKRKEMEEAAEQMVAEQKAAEQRAAERLAAEQKAIEQRTAGIEPVAVSDPVDSVRQENDALTEPGAESLLATHKDATRETVVEPKLETITNHKTIEPTDPVQENAVGINETILVEKPKVAVAVTPMTPDDIPGSFPAFSPFSDSRDPPPRPASIASETTEFDVEPQEHPPVQAVSPLEAHANVNDLPYVSEPDSIPQREYQYPFEGDNASPTLLYPHQDAIEDFQGSSYDNDRGPRMSVPGAFDDYEDEDEDEDLALHQAIGIGLGLQSLSGEPLSAGVKSVDPEETEKIPFPRLEIQDGSDCQSDVHDISEVGQDFDHTDACTEVTDEGELRDGDVSECPTGDLASRRDSSCASSPEPDALQPTKLDTLTVPNVMSPTQRLSQQSAWTDMTVESAECSDAAISPNAVSPESPIYGHATIYHSTPTWRESQFSAAEDRYSGFSESRAHNESNRSSAAYLGQPYSHASSGVVSPASYLSPELSATSFQIPVPSHEPPPVPMSATSSIPDSRRQSSTFNDASQYDSTVIDSGRGSDDYMSPMESTQSVSSAPLGTQDSFGTSTPMSGDAKSISQSSEDMAKKERHRLVQRRNVIKELLDTEAVFVRDMNIVEEIYKGTAEACPNLDDKTVKLIFRNTNEIIDFHTIFLAQIKEAVASVYVPKSGRTTTREDSIMSDTPSSAAEVSDERDREVLLGPVFTANMELMKLAHEGFLRNSDHAAKKLIEIQQDPAVKVWLNECNEVAKDLTAAWDLDSLLIKPMQRITKYPNLIITLLQHTSQDHPDREALLGAREVLETAIIDINKTKKNFELVGQIVGRKRKESDVRTGFARAFGKRVDKLQTSNSRPTEDTLYAKLNEKFGDDYLRLQVVLRDVEFYTRQVTTYVHDFLQYLSSVELVMRLQPGSYPELESKWVQFNISIRDLEKVTLEEHLAQVRKHVIEPFELVIKAYGNPATAMKKRQKRRVDYERSEQLKRAGKTVDSKVKELAEQYEALNEALKRELPQLSALTEKVGNICLGNLVNIQAKWYSVWKDKMKTVLGDCPDMPDLKEIVSTFNRDFPYAQEQVASIGILDPTYKGRSSLSTTISADDSMTRGRPRPLELDSRGRGLSVNVESGAPSLPIPDFAQRSSGSFSISPSHNSDSKALPSPHQYYYNYAESQTSVQTSGLTMSPEITSGSRSAGGAGVAASTRPSTGRSFDSGPVRQSTDSGPLNRRDSNATYGSGYTPQDSKRFSGLFHSALPPTDSAEEGVRLSRASSRERGAPIDGYNVLWLAASLFEFNIATTKHEAGYPYLVYQAGEIFDVVAEKGELWLAKNQDDPKEKVGWIWSKHFAKLADA